jgi:type I restriction enzyme R subunit
MEWLRMIRDHIASSVHISMENLDYTPFDAAGGRGRMWQLFGKEMNTIMDEMNEKLAV